MTVVTAVCTTVVRAVWNVNAGATVPNVNGALAVVGRGTTGTVVVGGTAVRNGTGVFTAVCTGTGVLTVVFMAVCTGGAVVVLSCTGVVVTVAKVLLTGCVVDTCKEAAAAREEQKKRTKRKTTSVFFRLRSGISGGMTGQGIMENL
jgi:hypothetical protein